MLHALMRGVIVVAESRANAGEFVGRDANAHARSAHQHAALGLPVAHGVTDELREIGIVRRRGVAGAEIRNIVAIGPQIGEDDLLQPEPGVISRYGDFHFPAFASFLASSATRSAVKPNFVSNSFSGADAPKVCIPMLAPCNPV